MCVCVHNNTRPIAVATRIALLHSSVIEIRCWTRYSFLLQKRHLSSNSERNTTRDKVFEMEIELSRAKLINSQRNVQVRGTLYKQGFDFKNRKIRRIIPPSVANWGCVGQKLSEAREETSNLPVNSIIESGLCVYKKRFPLGIKTRAVSDEQRLLTIKPRSFVLLRTTVTESR